MTQTASGRVPALKEWAAVIRALDHGDQMLLLRKGGIAEPGGEFRVEEDEFFFFPSYEHQKKHLIRREFQGHLEAAMVDWTPGAGRVPVTHFARVTEVLQIRGEQAVEALAPHYIYTGSYAQERLHWNPSAPLYVVLVRVYRLREPQWIDVLSEYSGCSSWLELKAPLIADEVAPVLSDAEYNARVDAVKRSVQL
jgi:hypothetical protein